MSSRKDIILGEYLNMIDEIKKLNIIDLDKLVFLPKTEDIDISEFVIYIGFAFCSNTKSYNYESFEHLLNWHKIDFLNQSEKLVIFEPVYKFINFVKNIR
jgi:hypothetical protein